MYATLTLPLKHSCPPPIGMLSKQVVCFKVLLLHEPAVKLQLTSHNTWSLGIPLSSSVHFVASNFQSPELCSGSRV